MNHGNQSIVEVLVLGCLAVLLSNSAGAAVPEDEAALLKATLTPWGAEVAGNKEGTIPTYVGGFTQPYAGYKPGGRRPNMFATDHLQFSITAQNAAQYADKLSAGTLALLKKYPDYKLDVYATQRTNRVSLDLAQRAYRNATQTKLSVSGSNGTPLNYSGGVPFPIPKTGEEAMWNHLLRQRGSEDFTLSGRSYLVTSDGRRTMISDLDAAVRAPTGYGNFKAEGWDGFYSMLRVSTNAPTIRAGEQVLARDNVNDAKSEAYAYLPGQRRVRRLPNSCCDSPSPPSAGIANVDDTSVWSGRLDLFNWRLLGKKEMFIPYNTNAFNVPNKDLDVVGEHFLNPTYVRWELHRVWIVEAVLKEGQRHTSPKSVYYLDEDTWQAEIADRWDARGELWKHSFALPMVVPDAQMTAGVTFGFYDLQSGTYIVNNVMNEKSEQIVYKKLPNDTWSPDAMAGSGVR